MYLFDVKREEYVEEKDLVAPDDALLLGLLREPLGPLVGHVAHLETELLRHESGAVLEGWRQVVLEEPELHRLGSVAADRQHHDS